MKLSPVFDGFMDCLRGSPTAQETGAVFLRYDSATTETDAADALSGDIGFCYVVQLNGGTNDNTGTLPFSVGRLGVTVFCYHTGLASASKNLLQATEVLTDLHNTTFETSEGREILVFLTGNYLNLEQTEPVLINSVTFELVQH